MLSFLLESAARSLVLGGIMWIALRILRIRTAHILSLAWTAVLLSSLTMPLLMKAMETVLAGAPKSAIAWIPTGAPPLFLRPPVVMPATPHPSVDWMFWAFAAYLLVAIAFLIRLLAGLLRSRRLSRTATPIHEPWTLGCDVRTSGEIAIPVTCGSSILLPSDWRDWDDFTRNAVLLHEQSHVWRRDFHVQVLAGLHRALFWFSPLAWWLQAKLIELAEMASDDAATRRLEDRVSYAAILLEFAKRGSGENFGEVAMARGKTVENRVKRLLRETAAATDGSWVRRAILGAAFVPLAGMTAGFWLVRAETTQAPTSPQTSAAAPQPQVRPSPGLLARWIELEVPEISTNEERDGFPTLRTDQEREAFIAAFWLRRDPTPGTASNEYQDEYYRRIVNANRKFTSSVPGWQTDRGRVLIRYGDPDEIETHAQGGTLRTQDGAAVRTVTFPFEQWRYRFIEGIGNNVILEFLDSNSDGLFPLNRDPNDKTPLIEVR